MLTKQQMRSFLAQFEQARADMKTWPKWMQDAARTAAATLPKPPADGVLGTSNDQQEKTK